MECREPRNGANIVKTARLKEKLLLYHRKLYETYGMVLCLLTLIDR